MHRTTLYTSYFCGFSFCPRIIVEPKMLDKTIKYEEQTLANFSLPTQTITGGNYGQAFPTLNFHICFCFCCYFQLDIYTCCNRPEEKEGTYSIKEWRWINTVVCGKALLLLGGIVNKQTSLVDLITALLSLIFIFTCFRVHMPYLNNSSISISGFGVPQQPPSLSLSFRPLQWASWFLCKVLDKQKPSWVS